MKKKQTKTKKSENLKVKMRFKFNSKNAIALVAEGCNKTEREQNMRKQLQPLPNNLQTVEYQSNNNIQPKP